MGHVAWFSNHLSFVFSSCLEANHFPKQLSHHIGLQKQSRHLSDCGIAALSKQFFWIFIFGWTNMQAKHVSKFCWWLINHFIYNKSYNDSNLTSDVWYFGFKVICSLNTSTNLSITVAWNLTDANIVIGRLILFWRSWKSVDLTRIENCSVVGRVGLICIFKNWTDSNECWLMSWVSDYMIR